MTEEQTCDTCNDSDCKTKERLPDEAEKDFLDRQALARRMCRIRNKVIVLSGKGGVGKSTVSVNLAVSLAMSGAKVGLLDIDIHGPSVPKMLDVEDFRPDSKNDALVPVRYAFDKKVMKVMSVGFLLRQKNDPVIWRGPLKMGIIRQFLADVEWGELDYLIIDSPPGTGDEPLSACQLIEGLDGAIVVTMPQEVSIIDVEKSINFCRQLNLPILGVVENMSGMVCPKCGEVIETFSTGGGEKMALEMNVPFLGRVPIDPYVMQAGDEGKPFISFNRDSDTSRAFQEIVEPILSMNQK